MDLKLATKTLLLTLAGCSFALTASAQWQWIDKDGRKVFSDRPPGAEIQEKNILKRPASSARLPVSEAVAASQPAAAASAPAPKSSAPKLSGKDPQLEAKRKQAEEEEAAKRKAEEEKVAVARTENCERAKRGLATVQSGVRVSTTNAKGEREIMDDTARAAETKRLQDLISKECK